jgi:glycosyltransferase involved in cell wall biosynthesis
MADTTDRSRLGTRSAGGAAGGARASALRRVAIVGTSGRAIHRLRGGLIAALTAERHAVLCMAPSFDPRDGMALDALGAERRTLPEEPKGFQLFPGRAVMAGLARDLAEWAPHVVLVSGTSAMPMALQAARRAKVPRTVAMVNGLPAAGARGLKRALELADAAVFHNGDHVKALAEAGVLPADLAYTVVPGAGVDLERFANRPLPPFGEGMVFLMLARLDRAKGILDFCEAARLMKGRARAIQFRLAGPPGEGSGAIPIGEIDAYRGVVDYLGVLDDVRPALEACHVMVYPSHAEGMPLAVLEAMATGRPIITTDVAGCRDTVDERVNGCLVPPADPPALAVAMEGFLKRPDLIPHLARASRAKAERRFDARTVNAAMLAVLGVG